MSNESVKEPRVVKVAIIGAGLAGLSAGYLLSNADTKTGSLIECHLFEKANRAGFEASSVDVRVPMNGLSEAEVVRVDVPMRSFQGGYYRRLLALYRRAGIALRRSDFSYSFSAFIGLTGDIDDSKAGIHIGGIGRSWTIAARVLYNGATGRAGLGCPVALHSRCSGRGSVAAKLTIIFWFACHCLVLFIHFFRLAILSSPLLRPRGATSFRFWAELHTPRSYFSQWFGLTSTWLNFVDDVLLPIFSAVCTAPEEDIWAMPAEELLEFVWLTLFTHHYVAKFGSRDVVQRLSANIHRIHLASPVVGWYPDDSTPGTVRIVCYQSDRQVEYSGFNHVVLATQANIAAKLVASYRPKEDEDQNQDYAKLKSLVYCLQQFSYRTNIVINHTDDRLLPTQQQEWRDLNLVRAREGVQGCGLSSTSLDSTLSLPPSYTMTTQVLSSNPQYCRQLLQTTNPFILPDHTAILSASKLERAIVNSHSKKALQRLSVSSAHWWDIFGQAETKLGPMQGSVLAGSRLWICGAYASKGIPLLEGCVRSAEMIVNALLLEEGIGVRMHDMLSQAV